MKINTLVRTQPRDNTSVAYACNINTADRI
jgi:hypothetical protein